MPDINSPKVPMLDQNPQARRFGHTHELDDLTGRWICPKDQVIAGYVDGTLDSSRKARVESHLARCERCRQIVADITKAQREADLPAPPPALVYRAIHAVPARSSRTYWRWVPAVAATMIVALAVATVSLRKPEQTLVLPSMHPPAAPLIAKSTATHEDSVPDVVRKTATVELRPAVISPRAGSVLIPQGLKFSWTDIPSARSYEIRVVTADGDLVWEGQTDKLAIALPSDVILKDGSYFVWVTSYSSNGRTIKSAPAPFRVKR